MSKNWLLLVAAALAMAPMAYAHDPAGTPDTSCENTTDERTDHDYAPPATGVLLSGLDDGNLEDCNGDTIPGDYDEHSEWSRGGAWLLVRTGDGVTNGSLACFGELGHHPNKGLIEVVDVVLGTTVAFTVAADTINLVGPDPVTGVDCGDFESDVGADFIWVGIPTFDAGIDGTYQVYVGAALAPNPSVGTQGHVCSPNCPVIVAPQCSDGLDNDGDGANNFPADPGCDSPLDNNESDAGLRDPLPDCLDLADNDGDAGAPPFGGTDWIDVLGTLALNAQPDRGCAGPIDESEEPDANDGQPIPFECLDLADNDGDYGKDVIDIQGLLEIDGGAPNDVPDAQCTLPTDTE